MRIGSKFRMAVRWKLNIRIGSFRPAVSIKRQINPKLQIDGILLTMVDSRTNFAKEISALLRETYFIRTNRSQRLDLNNLWWVSI